MGVRQLTRVCTALLLLAGMLSVQTLAAQCAVRCGLGEAAASLQGGPAAAVPAPCHGQAASSHGSGVSGATCNGAPVCHSSLDSVLPQKLHTAGAGTPMLTGQALALTGQALLFTARPGRSPAPRSQTKPPLAELRLGAFTSLRI